MNRDVTATSPTCHSRYSPSWMRAVRVVSNSKARDKAVAPSTMAQVTGRHNAWWRYQSVTTVPTMPMSLMLVASSPRP